MWPFGSMYTRPRPCIRYACSTRSLYSAGVSRPDHVRPAEDQRLAVTPALHRPTLRSRRASRATSTSRASGRKGASRRRACASCRRARSGSPLRALQPAAARCRSPAHELVLAEPGRLVERPRRLARTRPGRGGPRPARGCPGAEPRGGGHSSSALESSCMPTIERNRSAERIERDIETLAGSDYTLSDEAIRRYAYTTSTAGRSTASRASSRRSGSRSTRIRSARSSRATGRAASPSSASARTATRTGTAASTTARWASSPRSRSAA